MNRYNAYKNALYDVLIPLLHELKSLSASSSFLPSDAVLTLVDSSWILLARIPGLVADFQPVFEAHDRMLIRNKHHDD